MAEKKGVGHAYNVDFLNVVFAASSLFLFLSVDLDGLGRLRPRVEEHAAAVRRAAVPGHAGAAWSRRSAASTARSWISSSSRRRPRRQQVQANQAKVDELNGQLADVESRLFRVQTSVIPFAKATYDSDRYAFEADRAAGKTGLEARQADIEGQASRLNDLNLELEKTLAERKGIQNQLGEITGQAANIQAQIDDINAEQKRLRRHARRPRPERPSRPTSATRRSSTSWRRRSRFSR